jgi:hypothetical protein
VVIPSILAFVYLGWSIAMLLDSLADLDLLPLVMWMAAITEEFLYRRIYTSPIRWLTW